MIIKTHTLGYLKFNHIGLTILRFRLPKPQMELGISERNMEARVVLGNTRKVFNSGEQGNRCQILRGTKTTLQLGNIKYKTCALYCYFGEQR